MVLDKHIFIVAVGLPARGKSYLFKRMKAYFSMLSINAQVFNLGDYRRQLSSLDFKADYFTDNNNHAKNERDKFAQQAMNDAIMYIESSKENVVALYDGTNTTVERRNWIRDRLINVCSYIVWIELASDDDYIIYKNVKSSKINTSDYSSVTNDEEAINDFYQRIEQYKKVYTSCKVEELTDKNKEWLFCIKDFGKEVICLNKSYNNQFAFLLLDTYLTKLYTRLFKFKDISIFNDQASINTNAYIAIDKSLGTYEVNSIQISPSKEHSAGVIPYLSFVDLIMKLHKMKNLPTEVYIDSSIKLSLEKIS